MIYPYEAPIEPRFVLENGTRVRMHTKACLELLQAAGHLSPRPYIPIGESPLIGGTANMRLGVGEPPHGVGWGVGRVGVTCPRVAQFRLFGPSPLRFAAGRPFWPPIPRGPICPLAAPHPSGGTANMCMAVGKPPHVVGWGVGPSWSDVSSCGAVSGENKKTGNPGPGSE